MKKTMSEKKKEDIIDLKKKLKTVVVDIIDLKIMMKMNKMNQVGNIIVNVKNQNQSRLQKKKQQQHTKKILMMILKKIVKKNNRRHHHHHHSRSKKKKNQNQNNNIVQMKILKKVNINLNETIIDIMMKMKIMNQLELLKLMLMSKYLLNWFNVFQVKFISIMIQQIDNNVVPKIFLKQLNLTRKVLAFLIQIQLN